jgi:hypothetical protein
MKRKLGLTLAAVAMVAASSAAAVVTSPASASAEDGFVCILTENTWLRNMPWGSVLLTLHAGRGFRFTGGAGVDNDVWLYGHGAEAPGVTGWIPANQCH